MFKEDVLKEIERLTAEYQANIEELLKRHSTKEEGMTTLSGLPLKPIYTPFDIKDIDYARDISFPGSYPFTRGATPTGYRTKEWTVRQVWDVETTCTGPTTCTSQLTSSQGWSAPVRFTGSQWIVDRVLPDWQPCQDGTKSPGHQKFRFYPVDSNGQAVPGDGSIFAGVDQTDGVSGACGKNLPLVIRLPLRLQRTL